MTIAFNLIPYTSLSGLQVFAADLIKHLEIDQNDQLILFTNQKSAVWSQGLHPRAVIVSKEFSSLSRLRLTWYQQFGLIRALKKNKVDVLFCPSLAMPLLWRRKIVAIHDLAFLRFKEESSGGIFRFYLKLALLSAKYWSRQIVTISNFSRQEIVAFLKIPPEKISIISRGTPELKAVDSQTEETILQKFLLSDENGLKKKYWLYLGAGYYRKNLPRLLEAFRLFLETESMDCCLVIAGAKDSGIKKVEAMVKGSGDWRRFSDRVIFTGLISDIEKTALIKNALALALISLYEGFGLPPLEAQALDTPVLAGNSSSLPEVCGVGAYLVDPKDIEQIKAALSLISHDLDLRQKFILAGRTNLQRYSWSKTALEFNHIIQNCEI